MTLQEARLLKPGDLVTRPDWNTPEEVKLVIFGDLADPVVLFTGGGFWRSSRLTLVPYNEPQVTPT